MLVWTSFKINRSCNNAVSLTPQTVRKLSQDS